MPFHLIGRGMALKIIGSCVVYSLHCVFGPLCVTVNNPPAPTMEHILPVEQHGSSGDRDALRGIGVFASIPLLEISRRPGLSFCRCQAPDEGFVDMIT